jgi:hypothetical protein
MYIAASYPWLLLPGCSGAAGGRIQIPLAIAGKIVHI